MYESVKLGCLSCGHTHDDLIDRAHRDEWHTCPACGEQSMRRMLAAPNVRTRQSASYIDGTKRFGTVRESNQLKRLYSEAKKAGDKQTMKDVKKEQSKLGGKE
jgi:hypothetical protein